MASLPDRSTRARAALKPAAAVAELLSRLTSPPSSPNDSNRFGSLADTVAILDGEIVAQQTLKDVFRREGGFESIIALLSDIRIHDAVRASDEQTVAASLRLIQASFSLLSHVLQDHRGNPLYFATHVDGWSAIQRVLDRFALDVQSTVEPALRFQNTAALFDILFGLALQDTTFEHISQLHRSRARDQEPVVGSALQFDAVHSRVHSPHACQLAIQLALHSASTWPHSSPEHDDILLVATTAIDCVADLANHSIYNLAAVCHTDIQSVALRAALSHRNAKLRDASLRLVLALARAGLQRQDDVAYLFDQATASSRGSDLLLTLLQKSKQPAFFHFDMPFVDSPQSRPPACPKASRPQ